MKAGHLGKHKHRRVYVNYMLFFCTYVKFGLSKKALHCKWEGSK
jgi:hypothetical protein